MSQAILLLLLAPLSAAAVERLSLYSGYVTKVRCEGRLLVSAIGNESLVRLDALPRELGCGVLLKPIATNGSANLVTNLILETSTGTISAILEIQGASRQPKTPELEYSFKGDSR